MVYRPTVRYDDIFREYVNSLFRATTLDRNQIIRGALFAAAHSNEFQQLLEPYKKKDVPLPCSPWSFEQHEIWLEQCPETKEGGKDVNANGKRTRESKADSGIHQQQETGPKKIQSQESKHRHQQSSERREGQISSESRTTIINQGGISIKIG
jgi:hypothetical protein